MTTPSLPDIPASAFARRRTSALEALGEGVMVLPAAPVQHASRDTERPYHPDRELYYLTGATEPASVAVLVGGAEPEVVLFVRERDPESELWSGPRPGPDALGERLGIGRAYGRSELAPRLPELLARGDRIHYRLGGPPEVEDLVRGALVTARARGARRGTMPRGLVDPGEILDELRLVKDEHELERIRCACAVTLLGHRAGARALAPGMGEWSVQSAVDGAFRAAGARGPAFETIVGSGANACVLHYVVNAAEVGADDLVLVDAGAEHGLYHGDVTRTYPASGRFAARARDVYDLVEAARRAGVDAVAPGRTIAEVHDAVARVLADGLVALGVLDGPGDDAIESGALKRFFPHQSSHWLGLDVHDPGDYARGGASRPLTPGMVFTVEPGLYFAPDPTGAGATPYDGIGVRIEDDVLVTPDGCEVLTRALPTSTEGVEALVGGDV
jgi:Xaa-Pro aminopeptidase